MMITDIRYIIDTQIKIARTTTDEKLRQDLLTDAMEMLKAGSAMKMESLRKAAIVEEEAHELIIMLLDEAPDKRMPVAEFDEVVRELFGISAYRVKDIKRTLKLTGIVDIRKDGMGAANWYIELKKKETNE